MSQTFWKCSAVFVLLCCGLRAGAQQALTWEQVRARFEQTNPTLLADKLNIDESKAEEITAFLRPNPTFSLSADGTQIAPSQGVWKPFAGTFETPSLSYLYERRHKRDLRHESAQKATLIAESTHADLERTLLFNLRSAFVSTMQAKSRKSILIDWNCSACSTNRTCKLPRSICALQRSSCLRC
jgi:cobalt-zinc-cadmium efflux system outer membrane protein